MPLAKRYACHEDLEWTGVKWHALADRAGEHLSLELISTRPRAHPQALEKCTIEKDMAAYIKKNFDAKYGPTWHCIVGRNFGAWRWDVWWGCEGPKLVVTACMERWWWINMCLGRHSYCRLGLQ